MNLQILRNPLINSLRNLNKVSLLQSRYLSHNRITADLLGVKQNLTQSTNKHIYLSNNFVIKSTYIIQNNSFSNTNYSLNSSKMPPVGFSVEDFVNKTIKDNKIVVFGKTTCPFCVKAKELMSSLTDENLHVVQLDLIENGKEAQNYLKTKTGQATVPNIFINGLWIGGYDNLVKINREGRLENSLNASDDVSQKSTGLKPSPNETIETFVDNLIENNKVVVFSKSSCPFCVKVKDLFKGFNQEFVALELDKMDDGSSIRDYLYEKTGQRTFPNVYVNGKHLGGSDSTILAHEQGRLGALLSEEAKEDTTEYDYDMIVIGGGSGGLACSKQAASLGKKVAVLDFVTPTPSGTTWGLGGTCVNVGCIPKKLMHQAALLGEACEDSRAFGWNTPEKIEHNWETMRQNIQDHIGSLNWAYRVELRDKKVEYINALGQFLDPHRLLITRKNKKQQEITAKHIVIAVGGRPKYPDNLIGAQENTITSDDLFSLSYNPGKTLCVGASYVSLECAGFLKGIGLDVTVMVRSILLRGFDQFMANLIGDYMEKHGMKFIRQSVPTEIIKVKDPVQGEKAGEYIVKYKNNDGTVSEETFNTVVMAVGREALTDNLGLDKAGVKTNPKNKKVYTNFEQTNIDNIWAIGDVIDESSAGDRAIELTPVAIQAGQLLSKRIFGGKDVKMDYINIATTVFTPIEYGAIGYSEEEAIAKYGEENIEVFHQNFWPLEWTVAKKPNDVCYAKLLCNKLDKLRVVGLHIAGPNAGEITQGYAIAMRLRATKKDFDLTVGIHPTNSEIFTTMNITKSSGLDIAGAGC
jgi:glutaredoxin